MKAPALFGLLLLAGIVIPLGTANAAPNSAHRPRIAGLPSLDRLERAGAHFNLFLQGLRGSERIRIRRDDRVKRKLRNRTQTGALLFRGTVRRGGITSVAAGDLIGHRLRIRYIDSSGKPVALIIGYSRAGVPLVTRRSFRFAHGNGGCAQHETLPALVPETTGSSTLPASAFLLPVLSPVRELEVAVYGDYEFREQLGSSAEAELEAIMNAVDALYERELGISLQITGLYVFPSQSDLGSATGAQTVLEGFRNAVLASPQLPRADSMHLFTGRNLTGSVVGLSYTGVVCRSPNFAFGLSQRVADVTQAIIAAHEIAHSLNASHTELGQGIMSPGIDASLTSFAGKSLNEVSSFVDRHGSCLSMRGNSVSLSGKKVGAERFAVTTSVRGTVTSGCTLSLFGSRRRPSSIGAARTGKLVTSKVLSSLGATRLSFPTAGSGRERRYFLTATVECPLYGDELSFGASQPLPFYSFRPPF